MTWVERLMDSRLEEKTNRAAKRASWDELGRVGTSWDELGRGKRVRWPPHREKWPAKLTSAQSIGSISTSSIVCCGRERQKGPRRTDETASPRRSHSAKENQTKPNQTKKKRKRKEKKTEEHLVVRFGHVVGLQFQVVLQFGHQRVLQPVDGLHRFHVVRFQPGTRHFSFST